jgi:hypothetical protein
MTSSVEQNFERQIASILEQALHHNTEDVKQATASIKRELKRPATMIVLLKLLTTSENAGVT